MANISKNEVEHLAKLARIKLIESEIESLKFDLGKILNHFEELKKLDTSVVSPAIGGALEENMYREDEVGSNFVTEKSTEAFPGSHDGFLKIPPVFE